MYFPIAVLEINVDKTQYKKILLKYHKGAGANILIEVSLVHTKIILTDRSKELIQ